MKEEVGSTVPCLEGGDGQEANMSDTIPEHRRFWESSDFTITKVVQ